MAYDSNNIFAKILRGEIPCHKLYEDEDTLVFLDIMPRTEGHALVVTKEKARDLFDISPKALAKVMNVVQSLAPKIKEAVGADGVLIQQFNGQAAGQTVFHLHVHIVPIKEGVPVKPHAGQMEDQAVLAKTAEKIRKKLGTQPIATLSSCPAPCRGSTIVALVQCKAPRPIAANQLSCAAANIVAVPPTRVTSWNFPSRPKNTPPPRVSTVSVALSSVLPTKRASPPDARAPSLPQEPVSQPPT